MISTVDPEARHGHKTSARGFDGYKGHISIDPDSELIVATAATAGNAGDGSVAIALLGELVGAGESVACADADRADTDQEPQPGGDAEEAMSEPAGGSLDSAAEAQRSGQEPPQEEWIAVYGDAAYGTAEVLEHLHNRGVETFLKVQQPVAAGGRFSKAAFDIDLPKQTVACPAGQIVPIRRRGDGSGTASFAAHCASCPLRQQCTTAKGGRSISIHAKEAILAMERERQTTHVGSSAIGKRAPR